MKTYLLLIAFSLSLANGIALAESTPVTTAPAPSAQTTPASSSPQPQLCLPIFNLCKQAGYVEDNIPGKNIWANCLSQIMAGKTLANVHVDKQLILNCKNEVENQPCVKILKLCHDNGFTGEPKRLPMFDCLFPMMNGQPISGVNPAPADYEACKITFQDQVKKQPCLRVMLACKTAGYSPDAVNGEIFVRNCYNPVLEGKFVAGAYVDPDTIKACKAQSAVVPSTGASKLN